MKDYFFNAVVLSLDLHVDPKLEVVQEEAIIPVVLFVGWTEPFQNLHHGLPEVDSFGHRCQIVAKVELNAVVQQYLALLLAERPSYGRRCVLIEYDHLA